MQPLTYILNVNAENEVPRWEQVADEYRESDDVVPVVALSDYEALQERLDHMTNNMLDQCELKASNAVLQQQFTQVKEESQNYENASRISHEWSVQIGLANSELREANAEQAKRIAKLNQVLTSIERYVNHHGQNPKITAQEALSMVQHNPYILQITKGYKDGIIPTTHNPYAEIEAQAKRIAKLEAAKPKMAPVQGYVQGIPWDMHLEAYNAYCKKYGAQQALIEGGCRGGFGVGELDMFIPGWRENLSLVGKLNAEIESLRKQVKLHEETQSNELIKLRKTVQFMEDKQREVMDILLLRSIDPIEAIKRAGSALSAQKGTE
jgi:hypothetical protein